MAATASCEEHFRLEKLTEWPEPDSVSLMESSGEQTDEERFRQKETDFEWILVETGDGFMEKKLELFHNNYFEVLAREDIDEAVHAILFRENHVVKRLDTYFQHLAIFKERRKEMLHKKWVEKVAEPLQQRIIEKVISYKGADKTKPEKSEHDSKPTNKPVSAPPVCDSVFRRQEATEEKRTRHHCRAGKQYCTRKGLKETEKARLRAKSAEFKSTFHCMIPRAWGQASARPPRGGQCRPQKRPERGAEEAAATDLSQLVFERQFRSSRLHEVRQERREGPVPGTRLQRPRSWAAGESRHPAPVERRVMTAEVLGKHLASLQGAVRPQDRP